jgi:hypothetical protein
MAACQWIRLIAVIGRSIGRATSRRRRSSSSSEAIPVVQLITNLPILLCPNIFKLVSIFDFLSFE